MIAFKTLVSWGNYLFRRQTCEYEGLIEQKGENTPPVLCHPWLKMPSGKETVRASDNDLDDLGGWEREQ